MPKTTKSAKELADIVMAELRKHPECNAITRIRIIRPATRNWDVTVVRAHRHSCPPEAYKLLADTVERLRTLYNLSHGR
jgi:hypothetical protein